MAKRPQTDDRQGESRRILGQIEQQTGYDRTVGRLQNHLNAADVDQTDAIETWGTRIGRILGFALTVVMVIIVIRYLFSA